jgi:23S rRNA (guanosine2251-2'-O)-methyltransferase
MICGLQPVREAIRAHGNKIHRVEVEGEDGKQPQLDALARFATDQGIEVLRVERAHLDKWTKGARHQGAACLAPELALRALRDVHFENGEPALLLALDELEDPQNFGAILRSSVAFGATAVIWPEHRSAPLSPATFRASAGAVEHATLVRVGSLTQALAELTAREVQVVGLDANGDARLDEIDLTVPSVLVIGAEGKGLRKPVKSACARLARLPMTRTLGSLNASVAAALALYEARRQRGFA